MFSFDFLVFPQKVWQESYFFGDLQSGISQEFLSGFNIVD